ncbi:DUF3352 domain-containing protein [Rhodoflexus sp.]
MAEFWEKYKSLLIALLIGALTFGLLQSVVYLLDRYRNHPAWPLIPSGAVAVIEVREVATQWRNLRNSAAWEQLEQVPFFKRWHKQAAKLDSIADYARLLGEQTLYVSLHVTAKNDFDAIFYIPVEAPTEADLEILQQLFIDFQPVPKETRVYQGENLYELTDRNRSSIFTFLLADGYWVGSFTPYLIEDVVRTYNSLGRNNFQRAHTSLFTARQLMADTPVRLYLNFEKLKDWVGVFAELTDADLLANMTDDLLLGLDIRKNSLRWIGATANAREKQLTAFLKDNPPAPLRPIARWIPAETAYLYRIGATDGGQLYKQLRKYWAVHQPLLLDKMDSLAEKTGLDAEDFYTQLDGEIALAVSEILPDGQADRCILVASKDSRKALRLLEQAAKETLKNPKDTLFSERYGKLRIVQLPLPDLPLMLFGEAFGGFPQVFVAVNAQYLIFGNRPSALKNYTDEIERGNTWALPEKQYLFDGLDSAAHINLIVHHKRNWTRQQQYLSSTTEKNAMLYLRQWLFFTNFSFELSGKPQGHFLARVIIGHGDRRNTTTGIPQKLWEVNLGSPLREQPQLVINHNNRSTELIFQDQSNNLHLITANGKKLWSLSMGVPVTSGYPQIDYLNNGKLQYLLTTTQALYLVDRLGRIVSGFPVQRDWGGTLDRLGVIDYDNTKDYRFALSTANGNIFLLSKSGQVLQGWAPRKTTGSLAIPLQHLRIQSRDCMIAVQDGGSLILMKRNGESYAGFPVTLQQPIYPAAVIEAGTDFASYHVRILTESGELLRINFEGQVAGREQCYDDAGGGYFSFCTDQSGSGRWIVARQLQNRLICTDMNGKVLFRQTLNDDSRHWVQFFGFGAGADVVAVTNAKTELCRLYLTNGDLLTKEPIPSRQPVAVRLNEQKRTVLVFAGHQNKLQAWEVAL